MCDLTKNSNFIVISLAPSVSSKSPQVKTMELIVSPKVIRYFLHRLTDRNEIENVPLF